jgi:hypothetical protein
MKKIQLIFLMILFFVTNSNSQSFSFEDSLVSSEWTATNGSLISLSTDHYKEGTQSLCWETTGTATLTVSFTGFIASSGNSAYLQIYTPKITNDTLELEFLYQNNTKRTARYLLNYRGWREFNRAYNEYISKVSSTINAVRFTLKPSSDSNRKIFFDDISFNKLINLDRIVGSQWVLDKEYFITNNTQLNLFANTPDIIVTTPTSTELSDLETLRKNLSRTPSSTSTNVVGARIYTNGLGITRNTDGTVKGKVIDMSASALTNTVVTDYVSKLEVLAAAGLTDENNLTTFRDLLDHLTDQGFAEGLSFTIKSNDYTNSRDIPTRLLNILPACTETQKEEVLKLAAWISYYGMIHESAESYLKTLNSDVLYLYLPHIAAIALFQNNDALAVREMKAFKRFLERNTEYVPGGGDILKPDGTGFHHNTHYNNYMYSYKTWAEYIYHLKGTAFKINTESYQRFKKAIISVYSMATLSNNDTRYFANSLSGRNPFSSGVQVQFSKSLFEQLIEVGNDCLGETDSELAAAYNYFFESNKYAVTAKTYDGFQQFNYSPIGIYRKANWVATMRAPTTKFFGAEIYSKANRFGRYQSHGSLDIMYSGSLAVSGYPGNNTGGGWDWNVIPGTTTVHYTSWQDMMPNRNLTDRFDQFSKTKDFSGALSWGDCGMFATDFDQTDMWGSERFTPTNLVFRKSMYAFDGMIISLGSGISSSGTYSSSMITATNLFQSLTSSITGPLLLNGTEINMPHSSTISNTQDNWLLNPQGTGYFVPKGNDALELRFDAQKTPKEDGSDYASPITSANAAKAYLNHGEKPTGKSYSFVVIPATNANEMQSWASQMANGGGSIYEIHSQTGNLHALTYKPRNITAYTFYGATFNQNFGIVKSTTAEHLLMHRPDAQTGRQHFAVANPNLEPKTDATFGWKASTSQTTLTLHGEWLAVENVQNIIFHAPANGETQLTITFSEGEPIYFTLKNPDDTATELINNKDLISFSVNSNDLKIDLNTNQNEKSNIHIFNSTGQLIYQRETKQTEKQITIPTHNFKNGIYLCKVKNKAGNHTFKWLKN